MNVMLRLQIETVFVEVYLYFDTIVSIDQVFFLRTKRKMHRLLFLCQKSRIYLVYPFLPLVRLPFHETGYAENICTISLMAN